MHGGRWPPVHGNRGKVENCTVAVHLGYSATEFRTILDSRLYLPKDWADDPERRRQNHIPEEIAFQTKPQIALGLIDRALSNGLQVAAWTFDELYGRDSKFLDALDTPKAGICGGNTERYAGLDQFTEGHSQDTRQGRKRASRECSPSRLASPQPVKCET